MSELTFMERTQQSSRAVVSEQAGAESGCLASLCSFDASYFQEGFSALLSSLQSENPEPEKGLSESAKSGEDSPALEEDGEDENSKKELSFDGLSGTGIWIRLPNDSWTARPGQVTAGATEAKTPSQTMTQDTSTKIGSQDMNAPSAIQNTKEQSLAQNAKSFAASSEPSLRQEAKQHQPSMTASKQAESSLLPAEKSASSTESTRIQLNAEIPQSELLKAGNQEESRTLQSKIVLFKNYGMNGMQHAVKGATMKESSSYQFSGKKGGAAAAGISSTPAATRSSGLTSTYTPELSGGRESKTLTRNAVQGLEASGAHSDSYGKSEFAATSVSAAMSADSSAELSRTLVAQLSPLMLKQIEQMKKQQRNHIDLTLDLPDGQSLGLHLNLSGNAVKVRFDAESIELQSGLRRGWSELQSLASEAGLELVQPEFNNPILSTAEFQVDDPMSLNYGKSTVQDSVNQYA